MTPISLIILILSASVGRVGNPPNLGGDAPTTPTPNPTAAETEEMIKKAMRGQDFFTEDGWVFTCLLWPNLGWTVNQSEQALSQLLQEGKITEEEPGKYTPASAGEEVTKK